jgi:hypothetical protein
MRPNPLIPTLIVISKKVDLLILTLASDVNINQGKLMYCLYTAEKTFLAAC